MKPPARKRGKPDRNLNPDPTRGVLPAGKWVQFEQRNLVRALRAHGRSTQGLEDIDFSYLRKRVPTRSISEIRSVVDFLKERVIRMAQLQLMMKRWKDKKDKKPIELWTHMSSALAGTMEEPITAAFSQMLIVSSTEPRTLRNCDPPQVYRPPTDKDGPVGRTVPFRPMPHMPVKAERPGLSTARPVVVLKTPGPTVGPTKRLPAPSQVVRVSNGNIPPLQKKVSTTAGASPATTPTPQYAATCSQPGAAVISATSAMSPPPASQTGTPVTGQVTPCSGSTAVGKTLVQTTQQPSKQHISTTHHPSTPKSTSSSSSSTANKTPVPSAAPSSGASSARPTPPLSTSAATFHAKFGRTSKFATKDSPRMYGVKSVVDFERIYRYLSTIHQPNDECKLTPMESAIVLDLLMSLQEELPLLDCNKLHQHLIKVYRFLTSTADSKAAGKMFQELCVPTKTPSGPDGNRTNSQQSSAESAAESATESATESAAGSAAESAAGSAAESAAGSAAGSAASSNVADTGGKEQQPDGANASGQSGDADEMGLCPPLNPFMVPLKLLKRK